MRSDDPLVVLHEAAHAVVASTMGMDVSAVILHPPGARHDEAGRVELYDCGAERDADPLRFCVFLLSGAAAERRHCGQYTSRDAGDRYIARLLASVTLHAEPDSPRVQAYLEHAQLLATLRVLDDPTWAWVQRVATQLTRRRRMTGRDVCELRPEARS